LRFVGKVDDRYVTLFPVPVTEEFVHRGQQRFGIYCTQCHDRLGTGSGKVVQRGYIKPPSFQTDDSRGLALRGEKVKLTDVAIGYIFDVISNGYGAMPSHADMIPADDRWAIIAYVRALQLRDTAGKTSKASFLNSPFPALRGRVAVRPGEGELKDALTPPPLPQRRERGARTREALMIDELLHAYLFAYCCVLAIPWERSHS